MCGRFYIDETMEFEIKDIIREAEGKLNELSNQKAYVHKGDVYPTNSVPILTGGDDHTVQLNVSAWGFPHFNKKGVIINARSETVTEKRMFAESVLERRCIIPAKGFYEWDSSKNKFQFQREDSRSMYMAGIYKSFEKSFRFVILTTGANASMIDIHDRMPLILEDDELEQWLFDTSKLLPILNQVPARLKRRAEFMQQSLFLD